MAEAAPSAALCVIPVRSGSKGVPHKNIRPFLGRPLLAHSVGHARDAGRFADIAVSSDSDDYLAIGSAAGATLALKRPDELASDTAGSIDVLLHALAEAEARTGRRYGTVCLLQATSPLRQPEDVAGAVDLLEQGGFDCVVGVQAAKASPYFTLVEEGAGGGVALSKPLPEGIVRRQDAPAVWQINGAVYAWRREALAEQRRVLCRSTGLWKMPMLRSLDIDTAEDWLIAECVGRAAGLGGAGNEERS